MAFLSDSEGTTRTLLHNVLETHPLCSPVSSHTRSRRSLSTSVDRPCRNLGDALPPKLLRKQTKTAPAQPTDIGANGQLFVKHCDFMEEDTPRIILKKILQTASEASVLVPALNPQEPEPVELQEESKWNSLELQLPQLEPCVTVAPGRLVYSRRKRRLRVSEFEQEINQRLAVASDLTGEQPASVNKSSVVTRSFNLTLATVMPPESIKRPGLARRPPTRKTIDVEAFEQGLKDIPVIHLLDCHTYHSASSMDGDGSFPESPDSIGFRRSLAKGQELKVMTPQANQSPGKPVKSGTKSRSQNTPLYASSMSTGTRTRRWTGIPSQNSYFSVHSLPARSSISREAGAKSGVSPQVGEEEEEIPMDDEAKESEEDTEIPQRTVVSELSMKTPEFLRAKRYSLSQPTSPGPLNTNTTLLPSKLTQAKRAPKRRAGPRQPYDPYKAGLNYYCKVFNFYAKIPMEKSASETLVKCLDRYFRTLCDDLETFAHHAGRKTVKLADLELLMRRQGLVTDDVSLYVLVERYLPLEYRRLLIPCAASGNCVFPAG
ncbi:centromere protein T [Petaurus breviceps papuanus]|uniref:centromere protein T n=1 Tax=Petaurus breviceps papuanus TaxID=3040969 RepID=UPI0036DA8967